MSVALVLVSHDGEQWLDKVLEGIGAQTALTEITQMVAVDTGSTDNSVELLNGAFRGANGTLLQADAATTFPQAIDLALEQLSEDIEWVWILHDDSNPEPRALATLLAATESHSGADIFGPMLREWPSLRRILEIGLTISPTGRRETRLESGEYDQGQHSHVRTVLAVNTAGMLVRRSVLTELGGFDKQLPIFGNDIDFGWRAALASYSSVIVPTAVVFHAEAAHRGVRRTKLTGEHTHFQERRAALYTLLVNSTRRQLWGQIPRFAGATILRMIGFLLTRQPGKAGDEFGAFTAIALSPRLVRRSRRDRHQLRNAQSTYDVDVRPLLARWWLPYRHGLDFVSDFVTAVTNQASDVAERRRIAQAEADPASFAARRQEMTATEDDEVPVENGWVVRFFTNPVALALTAVLVIGLVAARSAFHAVSGGALAPAPSGAHLLWDLGVDSWHAIGSGSSVPAPAYVWVLAFLGTILLGHVSWAVSLILIAAFPMSVWGSWRLLRVVGRLSSTRGMPRWLIAWGATSYALIPFVSGAWGQGLLAAVVVNAVLPWLGHSALGFTEPDVDRRLRAGWRVGLQLSIVCAFAPSVWPIAIVLGIVIVLIGLAIEPRAMRSLVGWAGPLIAVATPVVLLSVWWLPTVIHGSWRTLLMDAGRLPQATTSGDHLIIGRLVDAGAPWWWSLALPALAVLALKPRSSRVPVAVSWLVGVVALAVAAGLSFIDIDLPSGTASAGVMGVLSIIAGVCVVAITLGTQGFLARPWTAPRFRGAARSWLDARKWVAGVVAVVAVAATGAGLLWSVVKANDSLSTDEADPVPAYMYEASADQASDGIVVIHGSIAHGLRYEVLRGEGMTLGVSEIANLTPTSDVLVANIQQLVTRPTKAVITALANNGIRYVVVPAPADHAVTAAIDTAGGLAQASTSSRLTRAWQIDQPLSDQGLTGHRSTLHIVLVAVGAVGLLVVVIGCLPSVNRRGHRVEAVVVDGGRRAG